MITSGAYIYTIVNVAVMHMRAPNRRPVVKPSGWWNTNGSRKMQHRKNIADIESLRPSLSTVAADMRSPGNSSCKSKLNVTWQSFSMKCFFLFFIAKKDNIDIRRPAYLQNLLWKHLCSSHPGISVTAILFARIYYDHCSTQMSATQGHNTKKHSQRILPTRAR